MNDFRLPDGTHIGYVHLQISDMKRSLHFYETLLGMKRVGDVGGVLSASGRSPYHILLTEYRGARPKPARSAGLYHIAIRYPNRRALAKAFRRLYEHQVDFQGFSDHLVSEAIYLADPDGNGIELYVDRPRELWKINQGQIEMATRQLDIESLMSELSEKDDDATGIDPNTDIGHVHVHVSDLQKAEDFYHRVLGFDVTQRSYPGALFLSAGGYHHHIGVNIWAGQGAPPAPSDAAGLLSFGIEIPNRETINILTKRFTDNGIPFETKVHGGLYDNIVSVKSPDALVLEFFSK